MSVRLFVWLWWCSPNGSVRLSGALVRFAELFICWPVRTTVVDWRPQLATCLTKSLLTDFAVDFGSHRTLIKFFQLNWDRRFLKIQQLAWTFVICCRTEFGGHGWLVDSSLFGYANRTLLSSWVNLVHSSWLWSAGDTSCWLPSKLAPVIVGECEVMRSTESLRYFKTIHNKLSNKRNEQKIT